MDKLTQMLKLMDSFFSVNITSDCLLDDVTDEKLSLEIINNIYLPVIEVMFPHLPEDLALSLGKAIRYCWGPYSYFELTETSIIFKHKDGRELEYFLLF